MSDTVTEAEIRIGSIEQIPSGEGRTFMVGATKVAVFRTRANRVFATQPTCPHRDGPLADGILGGAVLMCPLHERLFDLETGKELGGTCEITVYPVRKSADGTLYLTVPHPG